jgi:hypothetical protein
MPFNVNDVWQRVADFTESPGEEEWVVIRGASDQQTTDHWPWELKYVSSLRPSRQALIAQMLERGGGLALVRLKSLARESEKAVRHVSDLTQEGMAYPWIEQLIKYNETPVWDKSEAEDAAAQEVDLEEQVRAIKELRSGHCRFNYVNQGQQVITDQDKLLISELNDDLAHVAAPRLATLMRSRLTGWRYPWIEFAALGLLVIGPACFLLSVWSPVMSLILAALFPGFFLVGRQIYRDYACGQDFGSLKKHMWHAGLLAVSVAAAYLSAGFAFDAQWPWAAGLFVLASIILPAHYPLQRLVQANRSLSKLWSAGKLERPEGWQEAWLNLIRYEKSLLVRLCGLIITLGLAALAYAGLFRFWHNGWALAIWACSPFFIAESLAWFELKFELWSYYHRLKKMWRQTVVLSSDAW